MAKATEAHTGTEQGEAHAVSYEQQILLLSTLIQLEQLVRKAQNRAEFSFVVVNETQRLLPYRQALLWRHTAAGKIYIEAVSGADRPDRNGPYLTFIAELLLHLHKHPHTSEHDNTSAPRARLIGADDLPDKLRPGWSEWLNCYVLWCPLASQGGEFPGGLLFLGDALWDEAQIAIGERLAEAYAHAWLALHGSSRSLLKRFARPWRKVVFQLAVFVLLLLVLDQSVRLSVLAPVEIVPSAPYIVSSPMNGVVSSFHVEPNQQVKEDQLLFSLDDTTTRNDYEISRKGLAVTKAEYQRVRQKSFADQQSRGQMRHLEAEMARKEAEVAYMAELLKRGQIRASQDGIAVFADASDWLGKPVVVGEKVLTIADPARVEGQILLPVEDAINLEPGAEVLIFLNISPDKPIGATLQQAAYEAELTPEGILAFKLKVSLTAPDGPVPRIGLRGTAKIYGKSVPFYYYLFRRPFITLRQTLGM